MSDLIFREGTYDELIWDQVFNQNEYKIPDRVDGFVVVEVGGHIGSFASLCKSRGASECWSAEVFQDNFKIMCQNVAKTTGSMTYVPILGAVWRSDSRGDRMSFAPASDGNTGAGIVVKKDSTRSDVPVFQLDDILRMASACGRKRINILKLDCEGSEWPILFTSNLLSLVDSIVGEYHLNIASSMPAIAGRPYNLETLRSVLELNGFEVEIESPKEKEYNLFFARRVRFGGKYQ